MTTVPRMSTDASAARMASTARWSASSLFPLPWSGAAASAAFSVTRSSSSARLRSSGGCDISPPRLPEPAAADRELLRIDEQVVLVGQSPLAVSGDVHARRLQHRRHRDHLAAKRGL